MKLRPLVAWPFYNIPVITAFVNPFTSDAIVELTWKYSQRAAEVSAHQPAASN
ncbi:hypothetical protein HQQ94_09675 [Shewanella sp. VB17]|uniref:hypothetical protein n=1 Tax=Shewanella sp. VB17 TaxID=2739432 RepID=UPI001563B713|nr:hypothetical protein [Shewanella sp. VB17]NRD73509.1 hypothetical protein [Shewanella sp. VB17]